VVGCIDHASTLLFENFSCPNLDNALGEVETPHRHPKGWSKRHEVSRETKRQLASQTYKTSAATSDPAKDSIEVIRYGGIA
jgi:hypothetical protein